MNQTVNQTMVLPQLRHMFAVPHAKGFVTVVISTLALILVCLLFAPSSVTWGALSGSLPFAAIIAIVGLGQLLVVQQGGFDLSLAGAVSLPAVFWVTFAGAIHVLFAASLGLFVSVVTRGTGRAIVLTVLGLVAAWLLPQAVAGRWLGSSIEPTWLTGLFHYGLSPPATWRYLGFASESRHYSRGDEVLLGVLAGLAMYAAAAWFLWRAAVAELHLRRG